jgi:flagellar motor protein MotB
LVTIFFKTEEGWFKDGFSDISESGKKCLKNFSREWLLAFYNLKQHRDKVDRLVIEGHTNSKPPNDRLKDPYLYNLRLSQDRAYSAANFIFQNLAEASDIKHPAPGFNVQDFTAWRNRVLTATGRSFAEPILLENSTAEDTEKSKRIEFKFTIKHNYEGYKKLLEGDV